MLSVSLPELSRCVLIIFGLMPVLSLSASAEAAGGSTVIDIAHFGARPDSGSDATEALQKALTAAARLPGR